MTSKTYTLRDIEYFNGRFTKSLKEILEENGDLLNPRVDDYPSNDEIKDYFIENVHERF